MKESYIHNVNKNTCLVVFQWVKRHKLDPPAFKMEQKRGYKQGFHASMIQKIGVLSKIKKKADPQILIHPVIRIQVYH